VFPSSKIESDRAKAISDDLVSLCLPHDIVVDVGNDPQKGPTAISGVARRIKVRKPRLKPYWIHELEAVAKRHNANLLLSDGYIEFR
jgi:hypothetical protein